MKLFVNAASPYARLVRVILVETGLRAQTELHYVDPRESPPELLARNPAAKVPALELDNGTQPIESDCICDYLIGIRIEKTSRRRPRPTRLFGCKSSVSDVWPSIVLLEPCRWIGSVNPPGLRHAG